MPSNSGVEIRRHDCRRFQRQARPFFSFRWRQEVHLPHVAGAYNYIGGGEFAGWPPDCYSGRKLRWMIGRRWRADGAQPGHRTLLRRRSLLPAGPIGWRLGRTVVGPTFKEFRWNSTLAARGSATSADDCALKRGPTESCSPLVSGFRWRRASPKGRLH